MPPLQRIKGRSMSSHLAFNGCDDIVQNGLQASWNKKLPSLQKLLAPYRTDVQEIWLTVHCHREKSQRLWYEVRGVIQLPTGTLTAEAEGKDSQGVVTDVANTLASEIKRHKERFRNDFVFKRKTRERANLSAAGPPLQRDAKSGRREDFFHLLRPLLRFLRDHARREIRILELEGALHRGELTVPQLLDEVLNIAWQRFADRPKNMPLHLWLTDLIHEALDQWVKQEPRPHASLEDQGKETLPDEVPQVGEQDWWAWLLGYDESWTLGDLIPGWDGTEIWERLEAEEQKDHLLSLIRKLPKLQRQAFLLHALEDYTIDEIAMLQNRPESQVKADIELARQTLKRKLLEKDGEQELVAAADGSAVAVAGEHE